MYEHLLVAVDGGKLSESGMAASIELARKLGARITGFIAEPVAPPLAAFAEGDGRITDMERHGEKVQAHAHRVMSRFEELAREAGVPFRGQYRQADAIDDAILSAAEENRCDTIVMIKRDVGAFAELVQGSHSKSLLTRTKLPVVVLH